MYRISVIVPNFNHAQYLQPRLSSIINQTFPIHELILLDDASTDNSVWLLRKFQILAMLRGIKTRLVVNRVNSGSVFKQWKKGLDLVSGDYVWIAESDDVADLDFLSILLENINDRKDVVLAYANSRMIDENGRIVYQTLNRYLPSQFVSIFQKDIFLSGEQFIKKFLSVANVIFNVSATIFQRKVINLVDWQKLLDFTYAGDWFFYSNILMGGNIFYLAQSKSYNRRSQFNVTSNKAGELLKFKEFCEMQDYISNIVSISKRISGLAKNRREEVSTIRGVKFEKSIVV